MIPSGTELARPFLPAKDFDISKRFYETLGFEKLLDSESPSSGWVPASSSSRITTKQTRLETS